jgi:hypothetical protein
MKELCLFSLTSVADPGKLFRITDSDPKFLFIPDLGSPILGPTKKRDAKLNLILSFDHLSDF